MAETIKNALEPMERLLRAREVAAATALGISTVYMLMASGQLPSIRIGRAVRVPARALREWIETQSQSVNR